MTVYPKKVPASLTRQWEVAAIDVPVPRNLTDVAELQKWQSYLECLQPHQQMRKLAQALNQFHALVAQADDLTTLPEKKQREIFSKWLAARCAGGVVSRRFRFPVECVAIRSDMEQEFFYLIHFLRSVSSPEVRAWEQRRERYALVPHDKMRPIIQKFSTLKGKPTLPPLI